MSEPLTETRLAELRRLHEAATPAPWAWEQYGEKENCYHVGVAYDKNDKPVAGHVQTERYDEDADVFIEDILWRGYIGDLEGATVNYEDAELICAARNALPALLDEVARLRCLDAVLTAERDELKAEVERLRHFDDESRAEEARLAKERDAALERAKELEARLTSIGAAAACDADMVAAGFTATPENFRALEEMARGHGEAKRHPDDDGVDYEALYAEEPPAPTGNDGGPPSATDVSARGPSASQGPAPTGDEQKTKGSQ